MIIYSGIFKNFFERLYSILNERVGFFLLLILIILIATCILFGIFADDTAEQLNYLVKAESKRSVSTNTTNKKSQQKKTKSKINFWH